MATNYEILMGLSQKQMTAFINSLVKKEVSRYIDWNSWLNSEDPEPVYLGTDAFFKENGEELACRMLAETDSDGQLMRTVYMLEDKGAVRKETVPAWLVRKADEEAYPAAPLPEISEEEILQNVTESDSILEELLAETGLASEPASAEPAPAEAEAPETQPDIREEEPAAEETPAQAETEPETEEEEEEPVIDPALYEDDDDELPEIVTGMIEVIKEEEAEAVPEEMPAAETSEPAAEDTGDLDLDEMLSDYVETAGQTAESEAAGGIELKETGAAEEVQPETEEEEEPVIDPALYEDDEDELPEIVTGMMEVIKEEEARTAGEETETASAETGEALKEEIPEYTGELNLDELLFDDAGTADDTADPEATSEISLEEISSAAAEEAAEEAEDSEADDLQFEIDEDIPVIAAGEKTAVPVQEGEELSLDELLFGDEKAEGTPSLKLNDPQEDEFNDLSIDNLIFDEEEETQKETEAARPQAEDSLSLDALIEEPAGEEKDALAEMDVDDDIWKAFEDAVNEADRAEEEAVRGFSAAAETAEEKEEPVSETDDEEEGNEFFARGRIEMLKESLFDDEDQPPLNTGDLVFQETTAIEFPRKPSDGDFPQEHEPSAEYRAPKHMAKGNSRDDDGSFVSRLKQMSAESSDDTDGGDTFSRIFDEPNPFEEEEEADFRSDGLKRFLDDIKRESMLYDPDDPEDQELPTIAFSPMDESKEKMF